MPRRTDYPCCPAGSHLTCRYAWYRYKLAYVCFRCRKAFKRALHEEVDPGGVARPHRCPDCGEETRHLGLGFRAPRRARAAAWVELEARWRAGATFSCCGSRRARRRLR